MSEDEVIQAWQLLAIERCMEEMADRGERERVPGPEGVSYQLPAAAITGEVLAPGQRSLPELAEEANREHLAAQGAGLSMFDHAVRAGEALREARGRLGRTAAWGAWRDANFEGSSWTANLYVRVAERQDEIRAHFDGHPTLTGARYLIEGPSANRQAPQEVQEKAARLANEGVPYRQIAQQLGISRQSARRYSDPGYRQRLSQPHQRVGPAVLASRLRVVADAHKRHDHDALYEALSGLADAASAWAAQLSVQRGAAHMDAGT